MNQDNLLKEMGHCSLSALYNQLLGIEDLGRCINFRAAVLAKTLAFAHSFSTVVSKSMNLAIQGSLDL